MLIPHMFLMPIVLLIARIKLVLDYYCSLFSISVLIRANVGLVIYGEERGKKVGGEGCLVFSGKLGPDCLGNS